jgi:CDP-diacylglycerol--glycerol-3-phosphate 3-phosphatidyltransferase
MDNLTQLNDEGVVAGFASEDSRSWTSQLWSSAPNRITSTRLILSVALSLLSFWVGGEALVYVALLVHWAGDTADGALARHSKIETSFGAAYDIVADKISVLFVLLALLPHASGEVPLLLVFLACYETIDFTLPMQYRSFAIHPPSPNYIYKVDRRVFYLNWFVPAKVVNTVPVFIVVLLSEGESAGFIWVLYLWAAKGWSYYRLKKSPHRIGG